MKLRVGIDIPMKTELQCEQERNCYSFKVFRSQVKMKIKKKIAEL